METKTQNEMILEHLQRGLSIAPMEALRKFNCMRLGARIHNLREKHPIVTRMIKLPSGKWVARYRLIHVDSVVLCGEKLAKVTKISEFPPFTVYLDTQKEPVNIEDLS